MPVLIVAAYPTGGPPKLLVINSKDQKLHLLPMEEVTVLWHYHETEGWKPDFEGNP